MPDATVDRFPHAGGQMEPGAAEARGSEILVSSLVRDLTESTGEFEFEAPTDAELKGLSGIHRLSSVRWRR